MQQLSGGIGTNTVKLLAELRGDKSSIKIVKDPDGKRAPKLAGTVRIRSW